MSSKSCLKLVIVFFAGLLLGGVASGLWFKSHDRGFPPAAPREMRQHMLDHLTRKLDLSDSQASQLEPIIKDLQSQFADVRLSKQDAIKGIIEQSIAKANPILQPKQQEELQQMYGKLQSRWNEENKKE